MTLAFCGLVYLHEKISGDAEGLQLWDEGEMPQDSAQAHRVAVDERTVQGVESGVAQIDTARYQGERGRGEADGGVGRDARAMRGRVERDKRAVEDARDILWDV